MLRELQVHAAREQIVEGNGDSFIFLAVYRYATVGLVDPLLLVEFIAGWHMG